MKNTWKKAASFVLALALVAGAVSANVGGSLTGGTAIVASAANVVWSGYCSIGETVIDGNVMVASEAEVDIWGEDALCGHRYRNCPRCGFRRMDC